MIDPHTPQLTDEEIERFEEAVERGLVPRESLVWRAILRIKDLKWYIRQNRIDKTAQRIANLEMDRLRHILPETGPTRGRRHSLQHIQINPDTNDLQTLYQGEFPCPPQSKEPE